MILSLVLIFFSQDLFAEHPDKLYQQGKFKESLMGYEQIDLANPKDIRGRFNRGCAAYQIRDYQGAQSAFASVYRRSEDDKIRFKAVYNLGNAAFQAGDLKTAVDSYEKAVRLNPQDADARYNLELALRKAEYEKKQQAQKQPSDTGRQGQRQQSPRQSGKNDKQEQQKLNQMKQGLQQEQSHQSDQAQSKRHDEQDNSRQPKDLSGELNALSQAKSPAMDDIPRQRQQTQSIDRDRANALLNNIQEDRTPYLRFQVPGDKRGGVKSGKYW